MNKYILYIMLALSSFGCFAQETNRYEIKIINSYRIGENRGEFGYKPSPTDVEGPAGFGIMKNGNIVVNDYINKRNQILNKKGNINKVVAVSDTRWAGRIDFFKNKLIGSVYGFVSIVDENGRMVYFRNMPQHWLYCIGLGDVCFIYDNQVLSSLPNPGPNPEENKRRILDEAATRSLFNDPVKYGLVGVELDNQNRLFVSGELETMDYKTFYEYWSEINRSTTLLPANASYRYSPDVYYQKASPVYCGKDTNGNCYWSSSNLIMVFGSNGFVKDMFIPQDAMDRVKTSYAVHPSGDVYFLDYDPNGVYLYRVENVWDKAGRAFWHETNATVTSPNVRLRDKPSLNGAEKGYLQADERVAILETSAELTKVGDKTAPWYRVKTKSGQTAWAYGGFIEKDGE